MRKELEELTQAVESASRSKLLDFYAGLARYSAAKIPEWQPAAKTIWSEGSTRILDYGGKGTPVLFISPLINRANILDLSGGRSFMKFLKTVGLRPLLVDWGVPGADEKEFGSGEYIARLESFCAEFGKEIIIGGYCMGGLLALKLAKKIRPEALVLLATPWNFHSPDVKRVNLRREVMEAAIGRFEYLPHEVIQSLFLVSDTWRVYDKYSRYKDEYNEIEYWVNNGVPMSLPMARESIISWALENSVGKGEWLDVSDIDAPVFLACPTADKIVPVGCSIPLAGLLANSDVFKFATGHVGLVTSPELRKKFSGWLEGI